MSAINDAIAKAQAAANAAAGQQSNAVATVSQGSTAVAMAPVPGKALSMETLATGSINVDQWVKVKEFGLLIGDNKALIDTMKVSISMIDGRGFVPKLSIKAGNPAQYWSTTDGTTCPGVGTWDQAQQKALSLDPKARSYRSVDLPMTLLEPAVSKGVEIAKAGTILGHTTSTTNWKNWEQFYKDVADAGLMGQTVQVELGFEPKTNKANNNWGVVSFKLLGAVEESE